MGKCREATGLVRTLMNEWSQAGVTSLLALEAADPTVPGVALV